MFSSVLKHSTDNWHLFWFQNYAYSLFLFPFLVDSTVLTRLFALSLKSLVISWLPHQAELKSDEIVAQKHIKSDRLALTMMHKPRGL